MTENRAEYDVSWILGGQRASERQVEALERIADGVQRLAEVMETFLEEATFEVMTPDRMDSHAEDD